jgi:hypothetical protein
MTDEYGRQVRKQLGRAQAAVKFWLSVVRGTTEALISAETERTRVRAAWQSTIVQARRQHARAEQAAAERDGAYRERAQLLAWLATAHPAVLAPAPDVDEPGWQILYLNADGQQLSWHIHPRDAELYGNVEQVRADDPRAQWDGHTTAEKYQRIRTLTGGHSADGPS